MFSRYPAVDFLLVALGVLAIWRAGEAGLIVVPAVASGAYSFCAVRCGLLFYRIWTDPEYRQMLPPVPHGFIASWSVICGMLWPAILMFSTTCSVACAVRRAMNGDDDESS